MSAAAVSASAGFHSAVSIHGKFDNKAVAPSESEANMTSPGLAWRDIIYDIPLPNAERKAAIAASSGSTSEKVLTSDDIPAYPSNDVQGGPKPGDRRILHGLSGHVDHSELVGILGASGAGKTTLLNILSARVSKRGTASGTIIYKGQQRDRSTWKRSIAYVEQDDAMLARLTVRETIGFAAKLRLPDGKFDQEAKTKRTEEVVEMLRLEDCSNSRVGGGVERGVSGGERKRTSIGVELVSDVSILFLDEPTSGLDSFAANLLMSNLREVSQSRKLACLATLHQPSWAVFCMLDRVVLLAKGGIYYDGPPRDSNAYFSSQGYNVPEGTNPADYFISIAENLEKNDEGTSRVTELINAWRRKTVSGTNGSEAKHIQSSHIAPITSGNGTVGKDMMVERAWPTPWLHELKLLFQRAFLDSIRDKQLLYGGIGQTVFLLVLIGFAFFRLGDDQSDTLAKIGVLFFIPINASFSVLFPLITPFALQRQVLMRERSSGLYRCSSFFLAKTILELCNAVLPKIPFFTILYFMLGLRLSASHFFIYLAIGCVHVINAVSLGLLIGSVSPTVDIGSLIAPVVTVVFLLFGGNLLPSPPPWFIWLKWISPINYTYSALVSNEFRGVTLACSSGVQGQCYPSGDALLSSYNLGRFNIAENLGFMGLLTVVFVFLGYFGLRFTAKPRLRFI